MGFIDQLFSFLLSGYGLVFISLLLLILFKINQDISNIWILLVLLLYFSSLAKFKDQWTEEPPPLVPYLQLIREYGRPLSILVLATIIFSLNQNKNVLSLYYLEDIKPLKYLLLVQVIIFLKVFIDGNSTFALIAFITYLGIVYIFQKGILPLLNKPNGLNKGVFVIIISNIIFLVTNLYQGYIDIYAITFTQGRFLGTTGNPQHAAVLLASSVPAYMYIFNKTKPSLKIFILYIFFAINLYALIITGSRTGLIMAVITIALFLYKGSPLLSSLSALSILLVFIFYNEISSLNPITDSDVNVFKRFDKLEDTRSGVWKGMWETFTLNPIFGKTISGGRLGFGENSWLATASSLGLIGLIPMFMFGKAIVLNSVTSLKYAFTKEEISSNEFKLVATGIISLIVGSFFEAYLLGNLTFSLLILFLYLSMFDHLQSKINYKL